MHPQPSHVLCLTSDNMIQKVKSTSISPINYRYTICARPPIKRKTKKGPITSVPGGHVTLLFIKLWRAMTLRMREERYKTNIISFVFTAKERRNKNKKITRYRHISCLQPKLEGRVIRKDEQYMSCLPPKLEGKLI